MKRICLLLAVMAVTLTMSVQAQNRPSKVPAYPGLIERVQPNGDTIRTYLRGDEHKHWLLTEDCWQLFENPKGWLVYAKQKKNGQVVISRKKAHNAEARKKCESRWLKKHGVQLEKRE